MYCKSIDYHVTRYLLKVSFTFLNRLMFQGNSCKSGIECHINYAYIPFKQKYQKEICTDWLGFILLFISNTLSHMKSILSSRNVADVVCFVFLKRCLKINLNLITWIVFFFWKQLRLHNPLPYNKKILIFNLYYFRVRLGYDNFRAERCG